MEVEVRKVQKLGSSSVVVTLPKEWAVRLGLKPGSQVMLVDEGDSIRVVPIRHESGSGAVLDLSRVDPKLAASATTCIYLSGLDSVSIKLPGSGWIVEELKRRASSFMGVHVYEQSPGEVKVEVLIDIDKVDLPKLIRSMGQTMSMLIGLLDKTLAGEGGDAASRAEFLRTDFLRTLYVVLRYLMSRHAKTIDLVGNYQTALAASYMGLAVDLLQELVETAHRLVSHDHIPREDAEMLRAALPPLEEASSMLLRILANPSARRLVELLDSMAKARKSIEESMEKAVSATAGVLAGKLHDVLRLVNIAAYVATCKVIMAFKGHEG